MIDIPGSTYLKIIGSLSDITPLKEFVKTKKNKKKYG